MKKQNRFLLRSTRQMNLGAIISGVGFLVYLGASVLERIGLSNVLALVFAPVSLYVFASVAAGRRQDKEAVSYNLLWGQGALTILLCMCAALTIREWMA